MKYSFLMEQLVKRDFKVLYKRSMLGVLWSVLNPLLTMAVMALVFSQLFRIMIPHYPVYLFTGLVIFNYMVEATNQAMMSITGNFGLITKVYIPKAIFPFSKILSSAINLGMSILAMYVIVLISGMSVTLLHFLIIYPVVCVMLFSAGLGFLLSCSEVFFRDTQYLYGVFTLLWTYLTPILYNIDIIPQKLQTIFAMNPMYQFSTFVRMIVLYNSMPSVKNSIFCAVWAVAMFAIGLAVFRKKQNSFIYYA
jgi:ABC-2 type transport system permease protein